MDVETDEKLEQKQARRIDWLPNVRLSASQAVGCYLAASLHGPRRMLSISGEPPTGQKEKEGLPLFSAQAPFV